MLTKQLVCFHLLKEDLLDKILKNKDFINQNKELQLSIDIRIQKILDDNLNETINKHHAQGGVGIILDIKKRLVQTR